MSCKAPPHTLHTNANITVWVCSSSRCLLQSGTDECKALVWKALSVFYMWTYTLIYAHRHRHLLYKNIRPHTFKHKHNVSLVQLTAWPFFFFFFEETSLSELRGGWMGRHSEQISTYLHYVRWDERSKMDRFLLPERESPHLLHSDGVFQCWNLGRGTSEEALFTGIKCSFEWKSECVCMCAC